MKNIILGILILGSTSCQKSSVIVFSTDENIKSQNGKIFISGELFSGLMVEKYADGNLKKTSEYVDGILNGKELMWFETGEKFSERLYEKGEKTGTHLGWWKNGNLRFRYQFSDGKSDGFSEEYYQDGKLMKKFYFKDGILSGEQKAWRENGKLYINEIIKDGKVYGMTGARLCFIVEETENGSEIK